MESEFATQTSSDRYQIALEAAGVGIWDNDLLTNTIYFSGYGHELFNVPKGTQLNLEGLLSRIHPSDQERTRAKFKECFEKKSAYTNEYRVINPENGQVIRWLSAKGKVYFTEIGTPYRFTGILLDITGEIKAREKEQKLLALVDNSIELMSILENDQKNSYLNKAGMEMLGFDNWQQVVDTPISELHTPEDVAFVEANVLPSVFQKGRWSGMMNVRHLKTGEVFPVFNNTVRINDPITGEPIAIGAVMRDMRPELAAQKALQESERNFRTLVMQAPIGISIIKGEELEIELANDSCLDLLKLHKDVIGKTIREVLPEAYNQGFADLLLKVLKTGESFYGKEYEIKQQKNGEEIKVFIDVTYEPLLETDDTIKRILVLAIDVTDKVLSREILKQSEEELQKRVAERTAELERKNMELEEFTYVSSHDLQEPLRKIKMFRDMIREKDQENLSAFSKEKFEKIGESLERMSNSLKDLLNYASLNKEENTEQVDLNQILSAVENDLELLIEEKNAKINKQPLPVVSAVTHQMQQLFYNLLNNALKFSSTDKAPIIEISVRKLLNKEKSNFPQLSSALNYFEIRVKDNGIGFDQDKAEKIFGLFQRLHSRQAYSGTGIGLAMCKKIAEKNSGFLYAKSEAGKGAEFYILLPR